MHPKRGEFKKDQAEKTRKIGGNAHPHEFPADRAARIAKHGPSTEGYTQGPEVKKADHTSDAEYLGPYRGRF